MDGRVGGGWASDLVGAGRVYVSPDIGRGRAQIRCPERLATPPGPTDLVGSENMHSDDACGGSVLFPSNGPAPLTSTPISPSSETENTLTHLGVMITELGKHIGDTVTARLLSDRDYTRSHTFTHDTDNRSNHQPQSATVDMSQLNVVLKSEVKDPPTFRGDGTDKCTVSEWAGLMETFLKKKKVAVADRADELLSKLLGRAKDVV